MTDFGFVPGGTPFELAAADYVRFRPNTSIISLNLATLQPLATLRDFIAEVGTGNQTTLPVDDFWLVSHGTHIGAMVLPLDATHAGDNFENVTAVAASGAIAIPSEVRDPRKTDAGGLPIPCVVHIVGCFVGRFDPYMRALRRAMGNEGAFGVEAPNFWDAFYSKANGSPALQGALRYMLYDFRVGNIDALATRKALLDALKAKPYRRIDSSVVPDKVFEDAVPKRGFENFGRVKPPMNVSLNPPIVTNTPTVTHRSLQIFSIYDHSEETIGPFLLAGGPDNTAPRADRQTFVEAQLSTWTQLKPDYPLPFYERYDFASLTDFVHGFDWFQAAVPPDEAGRDAWFGTRHLYMVGVPVVDPSNDRQELVHDFFSSDGTVQRLTLSNNPNFFARVFTS